MKPLFKLPGKIRKEINTDNIMAGCLRYHLRVIVHYHNDGYIVSAVDLDTGIREDYYKWGIGIKLTMQIIYLIKEDLTHKYEQHRSCI